MYIVLFPVVTKNFKSKECKLEITCYAWKYKKGYILNN